MAKIAISLLVLVIVLALVGCKFFEDEDHRTAFEAMPEWICGRWHCEIPYSFFIQTLYLHSDQVYFGWYPGSPERLNPWDWGDEYEPETSCGVARIVCRGHLP